MSDCTLGDRLLALRRDGMAGIDRQAFHAKADRYSVKQMVYRLIAESDVRIDTTALEKAKTRPHVAADGLQRAPLRHELCGEQDGPMSPAGRLCGLGGPATPRARGQRYQDLIQHRIKKQVRTVCEEYDDVY